MTELAGWLLAGRIYSIEFLDKQSPMNCGLGVGTVVWCGEVCCDVR